MLKKILILSIGVFILLSVIGFWYWQRNVYSREVLKLEIIAPEEIEIFEEVEYIVRYKNNGNVVLEEPRLIFEFPENTILEEGGRRVEIGSDKIGDIYPGEERTITFVGRIVGGEGDTKTARAVLSYKPRNLKPRYESSTTSTIVIKDIGINFNIDIPSRIEAERVLNFSINYFSNLNYPLTDIVIRTNYPPEFNFLSSSPRPFDDNQWEIPLLNRSEGGRIDIRGELDGEIREQRIFRAEIGVQQEGRFIPLKRVSKGIEISRPSLHIFQRINNSDRYTANAGDLLRYEIFFRNVGEEPFEDLFLVARLSGEFFDLESIRTDYGSYNRGDRSIMWDWRDVPSLSFLNKGEEGKVEFWVRLRDDVKPEEGESFILRNQVSIARISEEFTTKVNSRTMISQKGYYQDDVFGNSGPIPPRVGEETTYTIVWQAENWYNDIEDTKVKAFLPKNVSLTGEIFPDDESFTFDNESREIIWDIGDMSSRKDRKSIAFQISLNPLSKQKGETLQLIHSARITADDKWTESSIKGASPGIDTTLPDDDNISIEDGVVD